MSDFHVEKPFLEQLATLVGTVIDQGHGQIPTDLAPSSARLSCLFGFSGLCGSFGSMHKTNKTNQTNQTNQIDQPRIHDTGHNRSSSGQVMMKLTLCHI
jgi:hypothetical protein